MENQGQPSQGRPPFQPDDGRHLAPPGSGIPHRGPPHGPGMPPQGPAPYRPHVAGYPSWPPPSSRTPPQPRGQRFQPPQQEYNNYGYHQPLPNRAPFHTPPPSGMAQNMAPPRAPNSNLHQRNNAPPYHPPYHQPQNMNLDGFGQRPASQMQRPPSNNMPSYDAPPWQQSTVQPSSNEGPMETEQNNQTPVMKNSDGNINTSLEQQRKQDLTWVKNFAAMKQNKFRMSSKKQNGGTCDFKIQEAQNLLKEALHLKSQLSGLLVTLRTDSTNHSQDVYTEFQRIKKRLSAIECMFADEQNMTKLKRRIMKVTKKRERIRQQSERALSEKKEAKVKRQEAEKKIDHWLQGIEQKSKDIKKAAELKKEADQILGEVRRKKVECRRGLDLLKALTKLRQVRKEKAHSRGVLLGTPADLVYEERLTTMEDLLNRQQQTYDDEERVLQVMMEVEQKETTGREQLKSRQKDERKLREYKNNLLNWLFGKNQPAENDPILAFTQYYEAGNHSLANLIKIRQEWDVYLSASGSSLPQGWVTPQKPSDDSWATALQAKQKR